MFKFDFNLDGSEVFPEISSQIFSEETTNFNEQDIIQGKPSQLVTFTTIDELIEDLPSLISYSVLHVPLPGQRNLTLLRRDLFDARFQLISESERSKDLDFLDAPSDLIPGVYEGGLKTWECSLDLACHLDGIDLFTGPAPTNIIEFGCGTAIPSLSLLQKFFRRSEHDRAQSSQTTFHLQDYNSSVLRLMTLPNIILTWYCSPASLSYRASQAVSATNVHDSGELPITQELISSFLGSLKDHHIEISFISGSWSDLESKIHEAQVVYDLVITSETIYQSPNIPSLVALLKAACTTPACKVMNSSHPNEPPHASGGDFIPKSMSPHCLVAAKVIYFGVGGGIEEFQREVTKAGGRVNVVFEKRGGVGRRIVSVEWYRSTSNL